MTDALSGRLAYFEWSAPPLDVPPDSEEAAAARADPDRWAAANPAYGIRITADAVATELGALETEDFDRERLGLFADEMDADVRVLPEEDWAECERRSSKITGPLVLACEVSVDRRYGFIAASGPSSIDGLHVEIVDTRRYTGWMVDRLVELNARHSPHSLVVNPSGPAGALIPDIETAGLTVSRVSGQEFAAACGAVFDDVVGRRLRHIGQPVLNLAAAEAVQRTVGDAWVFDRRGVADVTALVAVTLAAWGARAAADEGPPNIW